MLKLIIGLLKSQQYKIYEKPFQLNILGVRSSSTQSNKFDDLLFVFFKNNSNNWQLLKFNITTDPGTYWLNHPMNVDGTSILKAGQYVDSYKIGLHKGQYKALVQAKPVKVIRDYDRNSLLDFNNGTEHSGMFGINIHRASVNGTTDKVDKWSAGCQVFEKLNDFNQFMKLCQLHQQKYGNSFTYTLVDFRQLKRIRLKWWLIGITSGLSTGLGIYYFLKNR